MQINQVIETYLSKYPVKSKGDVDKISEIAVNCVSLSEAWEGNNKVDGSLALSSYDDEDLLIDTVHGCSWDDIPVELMNICLNRSDKVSVVRVFAYDKVDGELKQNVVGVLDVN